MCRQRLVRGRRRIGIVALIERLPRRIEIRHARRGRASRSSRRLRRRCSLDHDPLRDPRSSLTAQCRADGAEGIQGMRLGVGVVVRVIVQIFTAPISALAASVLYFELRGPTVAPTQGERAVEGTL